MMAMNGSHRGRNGSETKVPLPFLFLCVPKGNEKGSIRNAKN